MTLHYSQVRMDAPTPVRDALTPARSRPATAGHLRCYELARGAGTTMFLDATTNEPLGGSVELRQRPSTARPDLGGSINAIVLKRSDSRRTPVVSRDYQLSYLELVEEADSELAKMLTAERCAAREPAVWCLAGVRNRGSVTDPPPLTRTSAHSACGSKKEDFEHVESLLRRPRKIVERKKREMVEEESDPRKEVLLAYQACTRACPVITPRSP